MSCSAQRNFRVLCAGALGNDFRQRCFVIWGIGKREGETLNSFLCPGGKRCDRTRIETAREK